MMTMRKLLGLLLTLCLTLPAGLAGASQALSATGQVGGEDTIGLQAGTNLTVGTATAMSGFFATDLWGTNASDMDVRALLHGMETISPSSELGMMVNSTAIASIVEKTGQDVYYTYTLTLREGLRFSDGTPVTAQDYVFYFLLCGAAEIDALGGNPLDFSYIEGYEAWRQGEAETVSGIRLLSDRAFALSVDRSALPYFYSLELLYAFPLPVAVIAPGCAVVDDGAGAYIGPSSEPTAGEALPFTPGVFGADMLAYTLLDAETGYVFAPRVTSGPYMLESFDQMENVAVFVVNPHFPGNFEGQKPHIERLTFRLMTGEAMAAAMEAGEVCLLNKVTDAQALATGRAKEEAGVMRFTTYPRTGLAYLAFATETPPLDNANVRRAIALSLDIDGLVEGDESGVLRRVYGYYGLGQWMATYADETLDAQAALEALRFERDLEAAGALLDAEGWTLNAQGEAYAAGAGQTRHRRVDGTLEALALRWAKSTESRNADRVEAMLREGLSALGVALEITELPFTDMLAHFYRQVPREYNTFFLASSFNYYFDPYYYFNPGEAFQGVDNTTGLRDEALFALAVDMRETAADDLAGYMTKWLAFQERFAALLPVVPLYSSLYYDFYISALQGYHVEEHSNWAFAVVYAYLEDGGM